MPTVLIIDDQEANRIALAELVQSIEEHLSVEVFPDPEDALGWMHWHSADLILADYELSGIDGVEFIRRARAITSCKEIPIVMVLANRDRHVLRAALDAGATDFMVRPIEDFECQARCRNLLTQRSQQNIIRDRARWLEKRVAEATTEVRIREHETLLRLAKAGEYRDEETGNHVIRMAKYSRIIAEEMGCSREECDLIELAAPMHDIGKIGIPDHILLKSAKLTDDEFRVMQCHTQIGYEILKDSPSKYLQLGAVIALGHHEKFDGSGYPQGIAGTDIPLPARIVALADVYDALTSARPYKQPWSVEEAVEYLNQNRGAHFDPDCLDAFCAQLDRVMRIQYLLRDQQVTARQVK